MRLVRAACSEAYAIWEADVPVGQHDIQDAGDMIHAALIVAVNLSLVSEEELLREIDRDSISFYRSDIERSDCLVTVFRGEEIRSYADPLRLDEDEQPTGLWSIRRTRDGR